MVQIVLVGFGAGIAAAVLSSTIKSGAVLSLLLAFLSPLPILIVGLGWSHWAGLIAALVASTGLFINFKLASFATYLFGIGLPAWWLGYLALLARPVATPSGQTLEWYPVGRLVVWTAMVSAMVIVAILLLMGTSEDMLRENFRRPLELFMQRFSKPEQMPTPEQMGRLTENVLRSVPPGAAIGMTLINLMVLWLAAVVVKLSGRLARPWPDISAMTFPPLTPTLLAAACAVLLLGGLTGLLSSAFAASLAMAYVVLGFAVLHTITRGMRSRGVLLSSAYLMSLLWPLPMVIALLGLVDSAFDIRGRFRGTRGPPTSIT